MAYWRAFLRAAAEIPLWALLAFIIFDVLGLSLVGILVWFGRLAPQVQLALFLLFLAISILGVYYTGKRAWENVERERATLAERVAPKLDLVFDPANPSCVEDAPITRPDGIVTATLRLIRVGLVNLGTTTVEGVRVLLVGLEPQGVPFAPIPFLEMHDADGRVSREGFAVNPSREPSRFVAILSKPDKGANSNEIRLHYAVSDRPNIIRVRNYRLNLIAEGRNVPAVRRDFVVSTAKNGVLHFSAVEQGKD